MEPPQWNTAWVCALLVHLRRRGVPVHEARLLRKDVVSISFEPHLAQAEILEGLLLAWPGVAAVTRQGDRLMHAYSQSPLPRQQLRRRGFAGWRLR